MSRLQTPDAPALRFSGTTLTNEMVEWLAGNRDYYEFSLLHNMLYDRDLRAAMLQLPLTPDDFRQDHLRVLMAALAHAARVSLVLGIQLPCAPNFAFYAPYLESACNKEGADAETRSAAKAALCSMLIPDADGWYFIKPYFEAWYNAVQGKRIARGIQMQEIPDLARAIAEGSTRMAAAATAMAAEKDEMGSLFTDESMDTLRRRPTGIVGLDRCLNGGWGAGECYLLFSGTGGGKSIIAGQCAWNECATGGYPLVISTELKVAEYVNRIVSASCSIPINLIQDCLNVKQMRMAIASSPGMSGHLGRVDDTLAKINGRLRIHKVDSEDGLNARATIEREVDRYARHVGHRPTWVCLDWLGSVADAGAVGRDNSARIAMWESAATSCVKFSEATDIPLLVLAQAVNDSASKKMLTIRDIGIAKGIGKNMVCVIGATNTMDEAGIRAALAGNTELPRSMFLEDQLFCICKSRKGEGTSVKVKRNFRYQRFEEAPR